MAEQKPETEEQEPKEEQNDGDKLGEFFDTFSSIITDGDRASLLSDVPPDKGEQSTFDDDEPEEFLDASEMMQDEEE